MIPTRAFILLCSLAIVLQVILPPASLAKLYTWTDRNGVVRRTYYPPPPDQVRQNSAPAQTPAVQRQVNGNTVELYVTSWCPYCRKAIQYFQERGIAFTAYDIEKDTEAAQRKKNIDGREGVPLAVINGIAIHGFSPERYGSALR